MGFSCLKDTGEVFADRTSTRAKELIEQKETILESYEEDSLPTFTNTFVSKNKRDFTEISRGVTNAQQLAIFMAKRKDDVEELSQIPTQTQQLSNKPEPRAYEIPNVTLTGLGFANNESITYQRLLKMQKKKAKIATPNGPMLNW